MKTERPQPDVADTHRRWLRSETVFWLGFVAPWLLVCERLSTAWAAGWELAHGWAVPVLCALVVADKRKSAPAPSDTGSRLGTAAVLFGGVALAAWLPVLEANRLWPAAQWAAALAAAVVSVGWLAIAGGRAWVGHYAFPLFFMSTALAWPAFLHAPLVEWLARWNAAVAAELASLAGHPAIARGNIVEVGSGWVGVDEACAGLRSLQAVWMVAWFLGEAGRLRVVRRVALVVAALGLAFAGNAVRTVFLTVQIAAGGSAAHARWHDVAGDAAMVATFVGVVGLAWLLQRSGGRRTPVTTGGKETGLRVLAGTGGLSAVVVLLLLGAEVGTHGWFAWRGRGAVGGQWQLAPTAGDWRSFEPAATVRAILNYSSADAWQWENAESKRAGLAYVFRWENAGLLGSAGRGHSPEVCMPAIGAQLLSKPKPEVIVAAGRALEFERLRFETAGRTQHVFVAVWDAFTQQVVRDADWQLEWKSRLARVRDGRVRADRAQVVFVLETAREVDDAAAAQWLSDVAPGLLRAR